MQAYEGLNAYYGDLHNHCGISYGHGSLDDAFRNAREQLDFCSVTGHALWPDMPEPDAQIQYIVDFHEEGFARLRRSWKDIQRITASYHRDGAFVTFLSFEMHSSADGDRTIVYKGAEGEILEAAGLQDLHAQLNRLRERGVDVIAFPHHIGYKQGQRGINWKTFDPNFAPIIEIISMHGCSEADEVPRPFLHTMGPSDHAGTMQHGLAQGHVFGVVGSTDHHSAYPGSYGHGRTGLWAAAKTRDAIWDALLARRTYALTGDRIQLEFAVNDQPMGAVLPPTSRRDIAFHVVGGAPIDYVDVVKNGELLRRVSRCDVRRRPMPSEKDGIHTKVWLELGWGHRGVRVDWDGRLGISEGRLLAVEPRFRGPEVVTPVDASPETPDSFYVSHWERDGDRAVRFQAVTWGNPNNRTPATQGLCLEVAMPSAGDIWAELNGHRVTLPLSELLVGARAGRLGKIDAPSYRFHRCPLGWELDWQGSFDDDIVPHDADDVYYLRVRQMNRQWAWSSPIRVRAAD